MLTRIKLKISILFFRKSPKFLFPHKAKVECNAHFFRCHFINLNLSELLIIDFLQMSGDFLSTQSRMLEFEILIRCGKSFLKRLEIWDQLGSRSAWNFFARRDDEKMARRDKKRPTRMLFGV